MARRKRVEPTYNPDWIVSDHVSINGRHITPGVEIKIKNERGRFAFIKHVSTPSVDWVDVRDKHGRYRSFYTNRVKTVHTKRRLRP